MAAIKSYTDIEQSRKLAEILPLESADMYRVFENNAETRVYFGKTPTAYFVSKPCWSLTALLEVLPNENMLVKTTDKEYYCLAKDIMTKHYNNPIDACYEIVLELKRKELL
jgi:hypothetical protein